jgi:hypothetical protein
VSIHLPPKERFRFAELARALDKDVSTVWRWTQRGIKGHVLPSYRLGGQRYIDRRDFLTFLDLINGVGEGAPPLTAPPRRRQIDRVDATLDEAGL